MDHERSLTQTLWARKYTLVLITAAPVIVALALYARAEPLYASAVRIAIAGQPVTSSQAADAQVAQVRALATSPSIVASAIAAAGVDRDPKTTAQTAVTVDALGTSPLTSLTVTDRNPQVATVLSESLANAVTNFMTTSSLGELRDAMRSLNKNIAATQSDLSQLLRQTGSTPTQTEIAQISVRESQLSGLQAEQASLRQQAVLTFEPHQLGAATSATEVPSSLPADLALALVAGLLSGIAIVVVVEALRPRVDSAEELAGLFEAPELGQLRLIGQDTNPTATRVMLGRLNAVATQHGITDVLMSGPLEPSRLAALEHALDEAQRDQPIAHERRNLNSVVPPRVRIRVLSEDHLSELVAEPSAKGHLVVGPPTALRQNYADVRRTAATTGWPVIAVLIVTTKQTTPPQEVTPRYEDSPSSAQLVTAGTERP
ncbi:MAG: hypothetical protein ABI720_08230 [Actinomycetes bacterium]